LVTNSGAAAAPHCFPENGIVNDVNGLLILDKPGGMTSQDVVTQMRRLTGEDSIGHLGTLDPMATGVLPLLLGRYTRLAQFFSKAEKSYTGAIRFGFSTDTYDAEGEPTSPAKAVNLSLDEVRKAASRFQGVMEQMPPSFSAKKLEGKRAYQLAREGKPVVLKPVKIDVLHFSIESLQGDTASFVMQVSAGGYVRSVAHELGLALGCGAHLASLRRTASGEFSLQEAVSVEKVQALVREGKLESALPHPRQILPEFPSVSVDEMTEGRVRNGNQVNLPEFSSASLVKIFIGQRHLLAIGKRVAGTLFQPVVVFG
jgi:tRNA pseudouridine55 synthase